MDLDFTSEQEELRSSVRDFLEKECSLQVVRALVESGEAPTELWASMVGLDWPALSVPEEYGGVGLGFVELAVVAEELGRSVDPGPLLSTISQFVPVVREAGTPGQRERFLSDVASGSCTGAVALADHPRGWSLDDVTLRAERDDGGWVLEGTKYGVMTGHGVDEIAVVARAGDGVGAFVVPAADAGLHVVHSLDAEPSPLLDGHARARRRVRLPCSRRAGERSDDAGRRPRHRRGDDGTLRFSKTVGASDALFQMVLAVREGPASSSVCPSGSFQAMKHKMSNMFLAIERARSLCSYAGAAIEEDTGRLAGPSSRWPRRRATTANTSSVANRSSRSAASGSRGSTTGHFFMKRATADRCALLVARRSTCAWPSPPH